MNNLQILKNYFFMMKNIESVYENIEKKCDDIFDIYIRNNYNLNKKDFDQKLFLKSVELGFNVRNTIKNIFINIYLLQKNENVFLINDYFYQCYAEKDRIFNVKKMLENINKPIIYDNEKIIIRKEFLEKIFNDKFYVYMIMEEYLNYLNKNKNYFLPLYKKIFENTKNDDYPECLIFSSRSFDEIFLNILYNNFNKYKKIEYIVKDIFMFYYLTGNLDDLFDTDCLCGSYINILKSNEREIIDYVSPPFLIFFNNCHDYRLHKKSLTKTMYEYSSLFSFKFPLRQQTPYIRNEFIIPYHILEIFYPEIEKYKKNILTNDNYCVDRFYFLNENIEVILKRYLVLHKFSFNLFKNILDFILLINKNE